MTKIETTMKMNFITIMAFTVFCFASCSNNQNDFDASGTFETEETIISAEVPGVIIQFTIEEGQILQAGQKVGFIDSVQLFFAKKQLQSQIRSMLVQRPDIPAQIASLQTQLISAEREQQRISNLVKADAATRKQLDDATSQVEMLKKQLEAQESSLDISSKTVSQQAVSLQAQLDGIADQLSKCQLMNPVNGTVLTKYVEQSEMASIGKPLYKIADLSSLMLRAYITGDQLSQIKLNQKVKAMIDDGKGKYKEYEGIIMWINDKGEFTPKTIKTKEERADMVYAIKILVKNDGRLKIGMYGEVKF